jgi:hypothetical protein
MREVGLEKLKSPKKYDNPALVYVCGIALESRAIAVLHLI